jgi:hypothetical protein
MEEEFGIQIWEFLNFLQEFKLNLISISFGLLRIDLPTELMHD